MSAKMLRRRRSKLLASPDFSPLAALGFMLICFFLTFEMLKKPVVLPVYLPVWKGCWDGVKPARYLTLLCGREKVYLYHGFCWDEKVDSIDYHDLNKLIIDKKLMVDSNPDLPKIEEEWRNPKSGETEIRLVTGTTVWVKPTQEATFEKIVFALNEAKKCGIRSIHWVEIADWEEKLIAKSRK